MHADTAALAQLTAFAGQRKVASGALHAVARTLKGLVAHDPDAQILIFDDASGRQVDLNLHGSLEQVLQRLPRPRTADRPKPAVVAREITLLPRHWAWLATPGGKRLSRRACRNGQRTCARMSCAHMSCSWPGGDGTAVKGQTPVLPVVSGASSALCRLCPAEADW